MAVLEKDGKLYLIPQSELERYRVRGREERELRKRLADKSGADETEDTGGWYELGESDCF